MKKIFLLTILWQTMILQAQNSSTQYGFINAEGKLVIPMKYLQVSDFNEGYALALNAKKELLILDKTGKETLVKNKNYAAGFDRWNKYSFSEGLCVVANGSKLGCINAKGQDVIPCEIEFDTSIYRYNLPQFKNGYLIAIEKRQNQTIINKKGERIRLTQHISAGSFNDGMAPFIVIDKWGIVTMEGKELVEPIYKDIWIEGNGVIRAHYTENENSNYPTDFYCLLNYKGEELPDTRCSYISRFENGYALYGSTKEPNNYGSIDANGKKTPFTVKYQFSIKRNPHFENGLVDGYNPLTKNFEIVDAKGVRLDKNCNFIYKNIQHIKEGVALDFNKAEKNYTLYNINNCTILFDKINGTFSNSSNLGFKNGYAVICTPLKEEGEERKFMIIDQTGKVTYSVEGQKIIGFYLKQSNVPGIFLLRKDGALNYIKANGTVLYRADYNSMDFQEGLAAVVGN